MNVHSRALAMMILPDTQNAQSLLAIRDEDVTLVDLN